VDLDPTGPSLEKQQGEAHACPAILGLFRMTMAVLWTLVIAIICWIPKEVVEEIEDKSSWFEIHRLDKLIHAGIFLVFSILWIRAFVSPRRRLWIALGSAGLAILTEVVQGLSIIGRDGSIPDAVTDFVGALIGIALAPAVEPLIARLEGWVFQKTFASPLDSGEPSPVHSDDEQGPIG
jgi:VanZ family protein